MQKRVLLLILTLIASSSGCAVVAVTDVPSPILYVFLGLFVIYIIIAVVNLLK